MKRYGYLFDKICSFGNLVKAAKKAQRGKRFNQSTSRFNLKLEDELLSIQDELCQKTYHVGQYKHFYIYDPKKRLISALPYRDRVVQHALCNIIEPIFDKSLIHDSYACRRNKGSHRAVNRFSKFSCRNNYVLKCDIKSFFASIDHRVLYDLILKKIKDVHTLWLIKLIIDSTSNPGIPIGNLSSQLFANLYLNGLDHYVKESLKCKRYIRYMDDLVFFNNNKEKLKKIKCSVNDYLSRLKIWLHPDKSRICLAKDGVKFLGYLIYPTHRLVIWRNITRFKCRFKKLVSLFRKRLIPLKKIASTTHSWLGYAKHADSYNMRRKLFSEIKITG